MLLIPTIELKDGQCVRFKQARQDEVSVVSDNPSAVAERWIKAGARRLHIVDLDGAASDRPAHAEIIGAICAAHPHVPVQVSGSVRDEETVQAYLDAGVQYVIIGTKAVNAPHFVRDLCLEYPGHILVGLDARDGRVVADGWSKLSNQDVQAFAAHFERDGVEGIIYTDVGRDGMPDGVNVEATVKLARAIAIPVIVSDGIASFDDVRDLCKVADEGVLGALVGRALYEAALDLGRAQALADELTAKPAEKA